MKKVLAIACLLSIGVCAEIEIDENLKLEVDNILVPYTDMMNDKMVNDPNTLQITSNAGMGFFYSQIIDQYHQDKFLYALNFLKEEKIDIKKILLAKSYAPESILEIMVMENKTQQARNIVSIYPEIRGDKEISEQIKNMNLSSEMRNILLGN